MVISTRQKFLAENCSEINIRLDGHPICRVEHAKSLGLIIDDRPSQLWGKLKPASWNFEVGSGIIKKKKAESYNDV